MASFADAVNALVAERDRQFVQRIATEYNLDVDELMKKYVETAETAIKVPRKYKKRDPTAVSVVTEAVPKAIKEPKSKAEKQKCTACTSKKEPCKFSALKGAVFCKRHLKQTLGETEGAAKATEPKAAKEPKVKAPKKAPQPVHTHDLSAGLVDACDLCQSHGNPLVEAVGFELASGPHTGPVKLVSVESRLKALLDEASEESDGDEADRVDDLDEDASEEEYEEED